MEHESHAKRTVTSWEYIKDNFEPSDRLAVVIKRRQKDEIVQRLATAERLAGPRFQAWLRFENAAHPGDAYLSMNPLKPDARGRTKQDIAMVRHVYLDLDHNGDHALAAILDDRRLPKPSYVLNTSLGKHQVIWKVAGFTTEEAERLQRAMAAAHGADRAATDVTRVLRIPGTKTKSMILLSRSAPRSCPRPSMAPRISGANRGPSGFPRHRLRLHGHELNRVRAGSASPSGTGPRLSTGSSMARVQSPCRPGLSGNARTKATPLTMAP